MELVAVRARRAEPAEEGKEVGSTSVICGSRLISGGSRGLRISLVAWRSMARGSL